MPRKDDQSMEDEGLRVVDTSEMLTKEELKELKKLASLSRTTKVIAAVIFSLVGFLGFPQIVEWVIKHWH
jgi:hypothetical protein